jgi:hypothetical protein
MSVNKYKILLPTNDQHIDIPIEIKWDFTGRDESIDEYQEKMVNEIVGPANDFEIDQFSHNGYGGYHELDAISTSINYQFNFFDGNPIDVTASTISNWVSSYLVEGFTSNEVYYYTNPFTKSFFKLDFYDTTDLKTQKNYFTIILPVQQGFTELASISQILPDVNIKIPTFRLDYIGDKEGFFIYWLRKREYIDLTTFYMSAKFFDARLGVYVKMTNVPQSSIPNAFNFNNDDYFYYQVNLDYTTKTYEVYSTDNLVLRVGTDNLPIKWYEYVNP